MELHLNGRDHSWTNPDFDQKVLDAEREFRQTGLNIWGKEGCDVSCGACCYYLEVSEIKKPSFTMCDYMDIEGGKANCSLHGENKPMSCQKWACYSKISLESPCQRYIFARVAVDIIKTKTEQHILDLPNLQERH